MILVIISLSFVNFTHIVKSFVHIFFRRSLIGWIKIEFSQLLGLHWYITPVLFTCLSTLTPSFYIIFYSCNDLRCNFLLYIIYTIHCSWASGWMLVVYFYVFYSLPMFVYVLLWILLTFISHEPRSSYWFVLMGSVYFLKCVTGLWQHVSKVHLGCGWWCSAGLPDLCYITPLFVL